MSIVALSASGAQPSGAFSGEYDGANITWPSASAGSGSLRRRRRAQAAPREPCRAAYPASPRASASSRSGTSSQSAAAVQVCSGQRGSKCVVRPRMPSVWAGATIPRVPNSRRALTRQSSSCAGDQVRDRVHRRRDVGGDRPGELQPEVGVRRDRAGPRRIPVPLPQAGQPGRQRAARGQQQVAAGVEQLLKQRGQRGVRARRLTVEELTDGQAALGGGSAQVQGDVAEGGGVRPWRAQPAAAAARRARRRPPPARGRGPRPCRRPSPAAPSNSSTRVSRVSSRQPVTRTPCHWGVAVAPGNVTRTAPT